MGPSKLLGSLGSIVARIRDEIETPTLPSAAAPSIPGYTVVRRIGKGGMGTVYLARDDTLGRKVAIKFVSGFVHGDRPARRLFLSEAKAMAAVSHANVVHVYTFGESEGVPYIVMEYVEGQSLGRLLRNSGQLSEKQAVDILRQTVRALEAAWEQGIVHGDIKPSNILIDSNGTVRVCDFGLARPKPTELPTAPRHVSPGGGTPHYMSPEQSAGRPTDLRSDVYSLGVVLYEMLVGRAPFASISPYEVIRRPSEPLPPIENARPVSQEVSELYRWMTQQDPDDRPATHAALRRRINRFRAKHAFDLDTRRSYADLLTRRNAAYAAGAIAAVVAMALLAAYFSGIIGAPPTREFAHVISIQDFENLTDDADLDELAAALRHEIERGLIVGMDGIIVVPREMTSEPAFVESETEPGLMIGGTLSGSRSELVIDFQLDDAVEGGEIAADDVRGDAREDSRLEFQEQLVTAVAEMLTDELGDTTFNRSHAVAQDPRADTAYQRAVQLLREAESIEAVDNVIQLLEDTALALDPSFAPAHAVLGRALWRMYRLTEDEAWITRARASCDMAKMRGESLPEGYTCSGWINVALGEHALAAADLTRAIELGDPVEAHRGLGALYSVLGDDVAAEAYLTAALERDPTYPGAYLSLGYFCAKRDRYEEALDWYREAASYKPGSAWAFTSIGASHFMLGQYAEANDALNVSINIRETDEAWSNLGLIYLARGEFREAVQSFDAAVRIDPADYITRGNLARAHHWSGNTEPARNSYEEAADVAESKLIINPDDLYPKILLAYYYVMLGRPDEALDKLEQAIAQVRSDSKAEVHYWAAIVHLELDDRAAALEALQRARDEGYSVFELRDAPEFRVLKNDPEYEAIIQGE